MKVDEPERAGMTPDPQQVRDQIREYCSHPGSAPHVPYRALDLLLDAAAALTVAVERQAQLEQELQKQSRTLSTVWDGFVSESMNGVICSLPDTGIETPTHRHWCAACQTRWRRLFEIMLALRKLAAGSAEAVPPPPVDQNVTMTNSYGCAHHTVPQENCLLCFADHPLIPRLRAVRDRNEMQPPSTLCTDITVALGDAIIAIADADRELDARTLERDEAQQWIDSEPDWKAQYMALAEQRERRIKELETAVAALPPVSPPQRPQKSRADALLHDIYDLVILNEDGEVAGKIEKLIDAHWAVDEAGHVSPPASREHKK